MPLYLISYDLRKQRDYQPLWDELERWKAQRLLWSVWLADVKGPAGALRDLLKAKIDDDDGIAVIEIKAPFQWGTTKCESAGTSVLKRVSP